MNQTITATPLLTEHQKSVLSAYALYLEHVEEETVTPEEILLFEEAIQPFYDMSLPKLHNLYFAAKYSGAYTADVMSALQYVFETRDELDTLYQEEHGEPYNPLDYPSPTEDEEYWFGRD